MNNAMIYRKMFSLLNLCRWFLEVLHLVAINLLRSYRFPTTLRFLVFFSLSFFAFCHFLCGCHQSHQSHEFLATLQLFTALEFVARSSWATIWHLDVCIVFFSCFWTSFQLTLHSFVFLYQSYEFLANDNLAPRGVHCCSRKCEQEFKQKFTQLSCTLNNINTNCSFSASQYSATNDIVICWNQGTLPHQAVIRLWLDS